MRSNFERPDALNAAETSTTHEVVHLVVPDIGSFTDVPVIEVLVRAGDRVRTNDSLITIESEKASLELPAEVDGFVQEVKVKVGDNVSRGTPILSLILDPPSDAAQDSRNVRSAKAVTRSFAFLLAYRIRERQPDLSHDFPALTEAIAATLNELFLGEAAILTRGDTFALFDVLGRIVGIPEPEIAGPFWGTRKVLRDEFEFLAFTTGGSAAFRHRKTDRILYVAVQSGQLLIGTYDPSIDSLAAFVNPDDALSWVRGGKAGKRITNTLWSHLP